MRENPFRSKSQARKFFAMEARGELAPGTAQRWMDETLDFASLPEYVGHNPDEDEPLVIQMFYAEGLHYWDLGRLVEVRTFWDANSQLDVWGDSGRATFAVYILGELVYSGSYDLSMKPADLRRQMVLYLEQLGTEDADRLLGLLIQQNPELKKGYVDPDTGAWMSRRRFEESLDEIEDAVVSETITEDQPTVDAINEALLAGTVGIGTSGLVTEVRLEPVTAALQEQEQRTDAYQRALERERIVGVSVQQQLTDMYGQHRYPEWWRPENREDLVEGLEEGRRHGWHVGGMTWIFTQRGDPNRGGTFAVVTVAHGPPRVIFEGDIDDVLTHVAGPEEEVPGETPPPTGVEVLGAYGELPTTVLTEQFGRVRSLPWNPASGGWFLGGHRWIQYRRQQDDGVPIYAIVEWDGVQVETLFTGRVDEIIPWLQQDLVQTIDQPRTVRYTGEEMARGVRRISSNREGAQTYIVDGEIDADGFEQWVNDAVGFFNDENARSDMTHFPVDVNEERVPYRGQLELFRLHGPWRVEERAAIFKHRKADAGFMLRFRWLPVGVADEGQRVQLFFNNAAIRDIVIVTWLAEFDVEQDLAIVGFRMVNGDNGIEIMNGQVDVPARGWNKGHRTIHKIMDLLGVRAVFVTNGWPEEYYLNVGYEDNPFVYF